MKYYLSHNNDCESSSQVSNAKSILIPAAQHDWGWPRYYSQSQNHYPYYIITEASPHTWLASLQQQHSVRPAGRPSGPASRSLCDAFSNVDQPIMSVRPFVRPGHRVVGQVGNARPRSRTSRHQVWPRQPALGGATDDDGTVRQSKVLVLVTTKTAAVYLYAIFCDSPQTARAAQTLWSHSSL